MGTPIGHMWFKVFQWRRGWRPSSIKPKPWTLISIWSTLFSMTPWVAKLKRHFRRYFIVGKVVIITTLFLFGWLGITTNVVATTHRDETMLLRIHANGPVPMAIEKWLRWRRLVGARGSKLGGIYAQETSKY